MDRSAFACSHVSFGKIRERRPTTERRRPRRSATQARLSGRGADQQELRGWDLLRTDIRNLARFWSLQQFDRYDGDAIGSHYALFPLPVLLRAFRIGVPASRWLVELQLRRQLGLPLSPSAQSLPRTLAEMGPIFVKIGQGLSSRPDVVTDPAFTKQLQTLQDAVAPFSDSIAKSTIAAELQCDLDDIFTSFSDKPIAAASLGQVYRARLRENGHEVAVKVQRPQVRLQAGVDLLLLRIFAKFVRRRAGLRSDLPSIVDEFGSGLFDELNYVQEGRNCQRFAEMYGSTDGIVVPKVYTDYTTARVLTLEWLEGDKAGEWGSDAMPLIDYGIQCTLLQLLDGGFFHADPHPANLKRVVGADGRARLAFLDFGMMSEINEQRRVALIKAIAHFINKDFKLLAQDFIDLEFIPPGGSNLEDFAKILKSVFGKSSDDNTITNLSFGRLASNMAGVARNSQLRLPPYYALIIRSLTILEGIALDADPGFKIVDEAYPFVARRFLSDPRPELREALIEVLVDSKTGRLRWKRLINLLERGSDEEGDTNSSTPASESAVELAFRVLSDKNGEFLREILENEMAYILDNEQLAAQEWLSQSTSGLLPKPLEAPDRRALQETRVALTSFFDRAYSGDAESLGLGQPTGVDVVSLLLSSRNSTFTRQAVEYLASQGPGSARRIAGKMTEKASTRLWRSFFQRLAGSLEKGEMKGKPK